jgi:hypothetical protein
LNTIGSRSSASIRSVTVVPGGAVTVIVTMSLPVIAGTSSKPSLRRHGSAPLDRLSAENCSVLGAAAQAAEVLLNGHDHEGVLAPFGGAALAKVNWSAGLDRGGEVGVEGVEFDGQLAIQGVLHPHR